MFPVEHLNFSSDRSEANLYTINLLTLQVQTSYLLATGFAVSKIDKVLESLAVVVSIANKLMYIPNDTKLNYPLCRLQIKVK